MERGAIVIESAVREVGVVVQGWRRPERQRVSRRKVRLEGQAGVRWKLAVGIVVVGRDAAVVVSPPLLGREHWRGSLLGDRRHSSKRVGRDGEIKRLG